MVRIVKLPLRVRLRKDEPAYSFINRLAIRHQACSAGDFLDQLPFDARSEQVFSEIVAGKMLEEVATIGGLNVELLSRSTLRLSPINIISLDNDMVINKKDTARSIGRVCVACLREDLESNDVSEALRPHRRFWWDLAAVDFCPYHATALTKCCPKCSKDLTRKAISPRYCRCGYDLTRTKSKSVCVDDVGADSYFVKRLTGVRSTPNPVLDKMTLRQARNVVLQFGLCIHGFRAEKFAQLDPYTRAIGATSGFSSISDIPVVLTNTLDRLVNNRDHTSRGHKSIYGRMWQWLQIQVHPALDTLKKAVNEHWSKFLSARAIAAELALKPRTLEMNLHSAAEKLQLRHSSAVSLAASLGIKISKLGTTYASIPAESFPLFKSWAEKFISFEAARRLLGISRKTLIKLIIAGYVEHMIAPTGARLYVSKISISGLINISKSKLSILVESSDKCLLPATPLDGDRSDKKSISAFSREGLVLIERLKASRELSQNMSNQNELNLYHKTISGTDCARQLKISASHIRDAIANRILPVIVGRENATLARCMIEVDALQQFNAKYACGVNLAREFKLNPIQIPFLLRRSKIFPINCAKSRYRWYKRDEAELALRHELAVTLQSI